MIYLQLTRGTAPRNHHFPKAPSGTLLFYARPLPPVPGPGRGPGVKLISVVDERWKRCWIKSIALLPNVLAKNQAAAAGADEAVFVDGGVVSECSSSNFYAVIDGTLVTHPVGPKVLPGITRAVLLECAQELGIAVEERPGSIDECRRAEELFISSTTREVSWVGAWDDRTVGSAGCGELTRRLHEALRRRIEGEIGE
jgi:D-alanine transaminase